MFVYCNNNTVNCADSSGNMAHHLFAMSVYVCDGGCAAPTPPEPNVASIPDVGSGNYHNFDLEDCSYNGDPIIYENLSKEAAMMFYEEISAGDFSKMIFPPLPSPVDFLGDAAGYADYLSYIWDASENIIDGIDRQNTNLTYDPEGRPLYIESGYSVVTIIRVYYDSSYCATETEYFVFDESYELVFNDVISNTYMVS